MRIPSIFFEKINDLHPISQFLPCVFFYFCWMHKLAIYLLLTLAFINVRGQDRWDLRRSVEYALSNNISVRQADLQSRYSALTLLQSKASRLPSFDAGINSSYNFGRNENRTTGVFENNNYFSMGMQLQSQVSLFNWFSKKYEIEGNELNYRADLEQSQKARNDIALNVAIAYLQILLARQQADVSRLQLAQTRFQLDNTRKRVDAGALPELNAAELEAQYARDSSAYVTARATITQYELQMKALLNLDAGIRFDIVTPPVETIPLESLADLQPEYVFSLATKNLPQQKVNSLRLEAARKYVRSARGAMFPSLSMYGGLNSGYAGVAFDNFIPTGQFEPTPAKVTVNGVDYFVYTPETISRGKIKVPFGEQISQNFGQYIGVNLSIPIFNGRIARTNWERSKLDVQNLELTLEQSNMTLKQDIYTAYNDAVAALQKFEADKIAVETAEKSYEFAQKRYELNLLSTFDLINSQNNLLQARIQALYSQYDYIFKMKLLEFYKGQGLKL